MTSEKPKLVVLGTGFASFSLLKELTAHLFNVTVISPRNHFLFTPLLPSTTVGTLEFRSIIEPIRIACPDAQYYQASCRVIDTAKKTIRCEGSPDQKQFELPFDILVIGVGGVSNTYGIPGVKEYALFLKDLSDARAIRQRIIDRFEQATHPGIIEEKERKRLLHFVVVGGGPTGVEFAAEMHDFLTQDLRKAFSRLIPDVTITLLEASDQILNTFDQTLSEYTMRLFRRQRIQVRTSSLVTSIDAEAITMKDTTRIPYGLVVWSTGTGATDLVKSLSLPKDRHSRILTDRFFRVKGHGEIYALGDCATIESYELPATSQVAQQEGRYLAQTLKRRLAGKEVQPFHYRHLGMLAYIGSGKALADLAKFKGRGFATWIFWRSTYLTKLVSLKNKTMVVFDWFKTFIFGRDISRF